VNLDLDGEGSLLAACANRKRGAARGRRGLASATIAA
jgi:hypothetical protein